MYEDELGEKREHGREGERLPLKQEQECLSSSPLRCRCLFDHVRRRVRVQPPNSDGAASEGEANHVMSYYIMSWPAITGLYRPTTPSHSR